MGFGTTPPTLRRKTNDVDHSRSDFDFRINMIQQRTFDVHSESLLQSSFLSVSESGGTLNTPIQTFEPSLPDTSALIGMGTVVLLCVVAGFVWSNEVVPTARTNLAISKSRGDVKEYLDEIKEAGESERKLEKWMFSDWLNKGQQKEAAIPFLKKAKWNSGDNPVLVTTLIMGIGVIIASFTERVSSGQAF